MGRPRKDPFSLLDDEFKMAIASMSPEQIKNRIAEITLAQIENMKQKEEDQDLAEKKEQAKEAGAQYREATQANKVKVAFCKRVLGDKGKA